MNNATEYPKVTARIDKGMKEWIQEQCKKEHRSESNFVELALIRYRKMRETERKHPEAA